MKPTTQQLTNFEIVHSKAIIRYCKANQIDITKIERYVQDWKPEQVVYKHKGETILTATLNFKPVVKLCFLNETTHKCQCDIDK